MSGSLPAVMDRTPRIRILAWSPGLLPAFVMSTPASRFCIALIALNVGVSTSWPAVIVPIAPVTVRFSCVP